MHKNCRSLLRLFGLGLVFGPFFVKALAASPDVTSLPAKTSPSAQDFTANLKRIIQLAEQKKWPEIVTIAQQFDAQSADSLDYILFQSISHDAPVSLVKTLLAQGASLQPHFINILAQKNNLALAKALVPLGLDLHGADMFGRNALHHALEDFQSKAMFDYLLSEKVAVDARMGDKDPLLIALNRALTHNDALYYINALLAHQAPVLPVHRALLAKIKVAKPDIYQAIRLPQS